MGLQPLYPEPRVTMPYKEHEIYPYLLSDLKVCHRNNVRAAYIGYYLNAPRVHVFVSSKLWSPELSIWFYIIIIIVEESIIAALAGK